jgi:very-short-patch-repair endonuclease
VPPGLVPRVELFDAGMRLVARLDLGDEEAKLAVEADGKKGHAGTQMVAKDRRRDRRTGSFGWATERTTWFEVRRQQAALRERVVAAHEARRATS